MNLCDHEFQPLAQICSTSEMIDQWKRKEIHGKYPHQLQSQDIHKEATTIWLHREQLFPEIEGFIIEIQDGIIATR